MSNVQDQEAGNRRESSRTNENLAAPDERERPASAASAERPVESLGAGSDVIPAPQASAGGLESAEMRVEPAEIDMAFDRPEDAKAVGADLAAASSMDEPNEVRIQLQHDHSHDELLHEHLIRVLIRRP